MRKTCVSLTALIWLVGIGRAQASVITYTLTATGNGSLGTHAFVNASFVITSIANTSQIQNPSFGIFQVPDMSANVFVSGIGTATFTIPTTNVVNQSFHSAGFSDPGQNLLVLFADGDPAFATYDLSTAIGPLTAPPLFNNSAQFATTAGNFSLTFIPANVTFQATVQSVPEPSSVTLFGIGIVPIIGLHLRRFARVPT